MHESQPGEGHSECACHARARATASARARVGGATNSQVAPGKLCCRCSTIHRKLRAVCSTCASLVPITTHTTEKRTGHRFCKMFTSCQRDMLWAISQDVSVGEQNTNVCSSEEKWCCTPATPESPMSKSPCLDIVTGIKVRKNVYVRIASIAIASAGDSALLSRQNHGL